MDGLLFEGARRSGGDIAGLEKENEKKARKLKKYEFVQVCKIGHQTFGNVDYNRSGYVYDAATM